MRPDQHLRRLRKELNGALFHCSTYIPVTACQLRSLPPIVQLSVSAVLSQHRRVQPQTMSSAAMDVNSWMEQRDDSSRRTACDRCRGQKLRCERATDGAATAQSPPACHRCRRVGAVCTTTFPPQPQRKRSRNSSPLPPTPPPTGIHMPGTMPMMIPESPAISFPPTPAMTATWDDYNAMVDPHCRPDVAWDGIQAASWAMNSSVSMTPVEHYGMPDLANGSPTSAAFHHTQPMLRQDSQMSHMSQLSQPAMNISTPNVFHLLDELAKLNHALVQETARAKSILSPAMFMSQRQIDAGAAGEVKSLISRTFRLSESFTNILKTVAESWPMSNTIIGSPDGSIHPGQDIQVYHLVAMHLASLYATLTHLFGYILVYVRDCLLEPGPGSIEPQLHLPDLRIEGLRSLNNGYMQVCMFVEACMHLVELAHSRLRQIQETGSLGAIGSNTLGLVVASAASSPTTMQAQNLPELPLSQSSIRELHYTILTRLKRSAY